MSTEFKVGDICEAFGVECEVIEIQESNLEDSVVRVIMTDGHHKGDSFTFSIDGRYANWHKTPSLILKHRPKPKVMMQMYRYKSTTHVFADTVEAVNLLERKNSPNNVIKLLEPFEVEE